MADPFDVTVRMYGYNRVRNQLRAMASAHPKHTDPTIEKHAKTQAAMLRNKPYPPERPNQKYVRTGELGRRWRAQHQGRGRWAIINRRPKAVWVIKQGMQNRKYHLGRWWTMEDTLAKTMPQLTKNLSRTLEALMEQQRD